MSTGLKTRKVRKMLAMSAVAVGLMAATAPAAGAVSAGGAGKVQVQDIHFSVIVKVGTGTLALGGASAGAEICTDWTNDDGTHGTNCPAPPPGSGPTFGLLTDYMEHPLP